MASLSLQHRLKEIQSHIDDFKQKLADSEGHYQKSLELLTDPGLCSQLMEHHIIHVERQKTSIARLEELYNQVQNQLASPDQFDL